MRLTHWLAVLQSLVAISTASILSTSKSESLSRIPVSHNTKLQVNNTLPNPARVEILSPITSNDATRLRLYFGPFNVHGQKVGVAPKKDQMDPYGIRIEKQVSGFCKNCTVMYAKADTYYYNGTRASIASGIYNHHILFIDGAKRTLPWWLCDGQTDLGKSNSAGFIVSGVDEAANPFTAADSGVKSGYWIGSNSTRWTLNAELTNYQDLNQTVYVTAEVEYVQGRLDGYADASISLLSVTGCKSPDYHPPQGQEQYNVTSPPYRMPMDGVIISGKGHLHDGGINIVLMVNGTEVCDSRATYGGTGSAGTNPDGKPWETIHKMSTCDKAIPVKAGDILTIKSIYDTTLHPLRQSADGHGDDMDEMGTFFLNIVLTNRTSI